MAQTAEYRVIQKNNVNELQAEVAGAAQQGWKPILMSTVHCGTAASTGPIIITVILEHVLGT